VSRIYGDLDDVASSTPKADQPILQELRERHRYALDRWKETQEQRAIDMRYISGDPWDAKDRKAREDNGRPCLNHDELNQYINQSVNNIRQNPRGVKVEPGGNGASDKTAELEQGLMRRIEYQSHAVQITSSAFQDMVEGSYGWCRVGRRFLKGSFNQEIIVSPIANPDSVIPDPDVKEPDWSDQKYCFVLDPMSRKEFKRRWKKAKITDFSPEMMRQVPDWIQEESVLVCEYWRVETQQVKLYQLEDGSAVEELPEGVTALQTRMEDRKSVVQYLTNGIEILERIKQPGELIPIIPFIGLQRYIDSGSGARRVIFSAVRLAREPQMSLAYFCSLEAEEAGMTPKTPYIGYKGQFESDWDQWKTATKVPHAFLQADPVIDKITGQVLPLPQRQQFTPNFQQYEIAKDSARRSIQAAMGISPLPTAAQRNNEKSGVALERIQDSQEIGSYHFVDSYDRALEYMGRVIDSWIGVTYDTEDREVALRKADDSNKLVRLNTAEPYIDPATQQQEHHVINPEAVHDITISTTPSARSQREASETFLDLLIQNLRTLPIPPPQQSKLLGLAIRMKQLGPKGDEMADIISPSTQQALPPAAQAQLDQAHGMIQQLSQALTQVTQKLEAKLPELATRERIALINAKAGIIEAAMRAKSSEAIASFQADIDQIDRILALMPDPGAEAGQPTGSSGPSPQGPASGAAAPPPAQPQPLAA
jgi:hypothetical protein